MALTKPQFVHPNGNASKDQKKNRSIFDIDAFLDRTKVVDPAQVHFDLKTSLPVFFGKERSEEFKLSIFDLDYYNKDDEDPGTYSLTHFDEPIPEIEQANDSRSASPSLISVGHFALSSAGSSRSSLFPTEMTPELARYYLPGLQRPSMKPERSINVTEIRKIIKKTFSALKDEVYEVSRCRNLTKNLSDYILYQIKTMEYSRYKFTCIVNVGQNVGQDLRIASRCLWNDQTDTYITETFENNDIFAVAVVFAVYQE